MTTAIGLIPIVIAVSAGVLPPPVAAGLATAVGTVAAAGAALAAQLEEKEAVLRGGSV